MGWCEVVCMKFCCCFVECIVFVIVELCLFDCVWVEVDCVDCEVGWFEFCI